MLFLPALKLREHQLDVALAADEVVVDPEHPAPPADGVGAVQFSDQLFRCLGAGLAALEYDDVAELALKMSSLWTIIADMITGSAHFHS